MIPYNSNALWHRLTFLLTFFTLQVNAQNHIQWGELQEEKHKIFLDLQWIGKSESNQLWLKRDKDGYSIEKIDNSFSTPQLYPLFLDSIFSDSKIKSITCYPVSVQKDTIRMLVKYVSLAKQKVFSAMAFDFKGHVVHSPFTVFEGEKNSYHKLSLANDSSRFTLLQISTTENKQQLRFKTFNRSLRLIGDYSTELPIPDGYKPYNVVISEFEQDNEGNFIIQRDLYAKGSDISDKTFWLIDPRQNRINDITPNLGNATIESCAITKTANGARISGLYFMNDVVDAKKPSRLFYMEVDDQNWSSRNLQTYPCSLNPITDERNDQIISIDNSYSLPREDGGFFLFIERAVLEKKSLRLHPVTLGVANFDKNGKQIYFNTIGLRQSYWFGAYAHAYSVLPGYDPIRHTLHLIFNDHENNVAGNQPAYVLRNMKKYSIPVVCNIDSLGKISKGTIAHRDKESPVVSIAWSHQVSRNKMIMVGMEKKGYRMGWLTLDEVKGKKVVNKFSPATIRTEPRRQTYQPSKSKASQFPNTMDRRFDGFFGGTFGTSSGYSSSISDWLTKKGYPYYFGTPNLDAQFSLMARTKSVLWGLEAGGTTYQTHGESNESRFGFTLGKSGYIKPIYSTAVFALTFGMAWEKIKYEGVSLPYDKNKTGNFNLDNFSYYLSPSLKLFKPVRTRFITSDRKGALKSSWVTGLDLGMRIYLWREHWYYNDNNNGGYFSGIGSMPQIPQVSFYINIPIGWMWEFF